MTEGAIFFKTPEELRAWLEEHHATADEVWVGYYKKASGRRSLTWSEVVDEALCFGWIDGKTQRIDEHRYRQRLTPRRRGSNWSEVNVAKVAELRAQGRMTPAGEEAFAARREKAPEALTYERRHEAAFDADQEARFRATGPPGSGSRAAAFLPHHGDLLGHERQAPRDARAPARNADRVAGDGRRVPALEV